jgi:hypothetical protein
MLNYVEATPSSSWGLGKQSKMRMQAILAATCEKTPDTNLANHWLEREEFHVPIGDATFDNISEFLKKFEEILSK